MGDSASDIAEDDSYYSRLCRKYGEKRISLYSEHYYWLEDLDNGKTSLSYKDYKKDKGIKALETKIFYRNLELESLKKELNNLKNG